MALESFYGGKPGFSPVIKASFKYINNEDPAYQTALINNGNNAAALKEYTMDECFKDINYTDVWYGELCIIDTENKMNPNNGKLYRRTLKKAPDDAIKTISKKFGVSKSQAGRLVMTEQAYFHSVSQKEALLMPSGARNSVSVPLRVMKTGSLVWRQKSEISLALFRKSEIGRILGIFNTPFPSSY